MPALQGVVHIYLPRLQADPRYQSEPTKRVKSSDAGADRMEDVLNEFGDATNGSCICASPANQRVNRIRSKSAHCRFTQNYAVLVSEFVREPSRARARYPVAVPEPSKRPDRLPETHRI